MEWIEICKDKYYRLAECVLSYTSKDGQLVFTKLPVLEITWWIIYNFNISSYVLKSSNSLVSRKFGICMTGAYSVCYVRLLSFRLVSIRPSVLFTSVAALANYEFFPSSVSSSFSQNLLNNFFYSKFRHNNKKIRNHFLSILRWY